MEVKKIIEDFFVDKNISVALPSGHNSFSGNTHPEQGPKDVSNDRTTNLVIFQKPLIGYADAEDPLFLEYKTKYEVTYHAFELPTDWLPTAKTVISIFLPFSDHIVLSNQLNPKLPSYEWTYGRYDGQQIINNFSKYLEDQLHALGYDAIAPSISKDFNATYGDGSSDPMGNKGFTSNWSERHVAFACGQGTFGLSKGLITEKGIAGRFTSIITNLEHAPTKRNYTDIYEYCTMCGKCLENCPPNAITMEFGKNHPSCANFQRAIKKFYDPRFGCGKCQVDVPCSRQIPPKT
jgi:epoxyqueuosine reductase QueG